jgi:hypothetical protein
VTAVTRRIPALLFAGVLAVGPVGCGGGAADNTPNPSLEVPKSTSQPGDVQAGRGATMKPPK